MYLVLFAVGLLITAAGSADHRIWHSDQCVQPRQHADHLRHGRRRGRSHPDGAWRRDPATQSDFRRAQQPPGGAPRRECSCGSSAPLPSLPNPSPTRWCRRPPAFRRRRCARRRRRPTLVATAPGRRAAFPGCLQRAAVRTARLAALEVEVRGRSAAGCGRASGDGRPDEAPLSPRAPQRPDVLAAASGAVSRHRAAGRAEGLDAAEPRQRHE